MASWLPLLVIVLAVALVIGPVMWLKPSARERRLASLRQSAASEGLKVQMQSLPAAVGTGTAAVYIAGWRNPRKLNTGWGLELQRMSHEMHFDGVWDWRNGRRAPKAAESALRDLVEQLPADATAVLCTDGGLGVQWKEISGESGLKAIQHALSELRPIIEEAIREPQRSDSRSENGEDERGH